jgi:RNA ligase (TIGR02306 family)
MRNLVSLRQISELRPIPNADAIETAVVDGWEVVVKKGEFQAGETCLYVEIDSFVPNEVAPFLTRDGKNPKEFEGVVGERLRTIRLRKQLSQGLILPLSTLFNRDLSAILGVIKWERPLAACLRGMAKGNFPQYIRKTDQERIQNCVEVLDDQDTVYEISLKLDGSSCTTYCFKEYVGVCSRNIDLKMDESNDANRFISTATNHGFVDVVFDEFKETGRSLAIQAELMGPGIQGNRENFSDFRLFIFDVWDIDQQRYMSPMERYEFLAKHRLNSHHIPVYPIFMTLDQIGVSSIMDILQFIDGSHPFDIVGTTITKPIEGIVFKRIDGAASFKAISNKFLEREKDSD